MKILLIDDSAAMRKIIRRVVNTFGWRISWCEARDGRQGIEVFRKEQPHLVITDWNMPTVDGKGLIEAFKRNGVDVPIGMVTGNGSKTGVERAQAAGAAFVVTKPFVPDDLKGALTLLWLPSRG